MRVAVSGDVRESNFLVPHILRHDHNDLLNRHSSLQAAQIKGIDYRERFRGVPDEGRANKSVEMADAYLVRPDRAVPWDVRFGWVQPLL